MVTYADIWLFRFLVIMLYILCFKIEIMKDKWIGPADPHSFARPDDNEIKHIHLELDVNFDKQILSGCAKLTVNWKNKDVKQLVLDTRELAIKSVTWRNNENLKFIVEEPLSEYGSKMVVIVPDTADSESEITISYETAPTCSALQWLQPEQTVGKTHPYMFSQCAAIHCRSMIPCQDTPAVKITYSANVTAPPGITVVMSAVRDATDGQQRFLQEVPIPAYLIAIAAGALESRRIGPRSLIWAEKEMVDKAAWEFEDTEKVIATAEALAGPYVWKEYNILVLLPSFAYGGMENPCLTFLMPFIVVGDRSLVTIVAHEVSHSWSGNLVTNKTFEHVWLNEGFTTFIERKINARLYGEKERHFLALGGLKTLRDCVNQLGPDNGLTCLIPDLNGLSPDLAFSTIPYEKGHTFLFYLEEKLGGPDVFDGFLRAYVDRFKYMSITSDDFKSFFLSYFKKEVEAGILDDLDWDAWFNQPGMPPVIPKYDTTLADACIKLCSRWVQWNSSSEECPFTIKDLVQLRTQQIIVFVALLLEEEPLPLDKIQKMEQVYDMNSRMNVEILFRWLRLCIKAKWKEQMSLVVQFLSEKGRTRYVRPMYLDLFRGEETKQLALDTFAKHRGKLMIPVANLVAKDLQLS